MPMKLTKDYTRKNKRVALAVMLALGALLSGCGPARPTATATPTASVGPTASAQIVPKAGGSLHVSMPASTEAEHPLTVKTREMSSIYGLIFEGLLQSGSGAPAPALAEKMPLSTEGPLLTFTLRKGAKWQGSGRELQAKDVLFTLDQIQALGAECTYAYVLDWVESWQEGTGGTVVLKLKKPFYGALHALSFPILPWDGGFDGKAMPAIPYGTGPYVCETFQPGTSIKLKVNPDWWMKPPYIQNIEALPFSDNATAIKSLVLRQLDAVQTNDLTVAQYRDSGDASVYEYPTHTFDYLAVNFASPDLQDKRMRQAIAYALDRREIAAWAYSNHAIVADTPVPPDSWLYDGKVLHYNKDIKQARSLIEAVGWSAKEDGIWSRSPDGMERNLKIRILTNREETNTLRVDTARLIADQLTAAGIQTEVVTLGWDEYLNKLQEKDFDLALCGSYLSPVPDLSFLLRTDGSLNIGGWGNADIDAKLDQIVQTAKSEELGLRMAELQGVIIDELPIISLYFRTHSLLTSPNLLGVTGVREESAYANMAQWYLP